MSALGPLENAVVGFVEFVGTSYRPKWRRITSIVATGLVGFSVAAGLAGQETSTWKVSPEAVEIGQGVDELFEAVQFGRFLPDGRVVVADVGGSFLRLYRADGTRQAELGGQGFGPGEFRFIYGLWLTPEDNIGVWDPRNRRFTIFDLEGSLVDTYPVRPDGEVAAGNLEIFLGSFRNGDILLASLQLVRPQRPGDPILERWVLGRFGPEGEFRGSPGELRGMLRAGRAPVPFSPVPRATVREDSIWIVDGYEPVITVLDSEGNATRTIDVALLVRPADDPWSALEAELRRRDSKFYLELLDEAPRTDKFPPVGGLHMDDQGRLWIKKYDPSRDALWLKRNALEVGPGGERRVLEPTGQWVATVRMPDNLIPLDISGDRILGVVRDALDVEQVMVHTVVK